MALGEAHLEWDRNLAVLLLPFGAPFTSPALRNVGQLALEATFDGAFKVGRRLFFELLVEPVHEEFAESD